MLANEIAKRIRQYVYYTIYDDVEGSVHDGVVTLTGKVTMPYKTSDIGDLVARVPGVREVDNKISTLPVSMFDDQLDPGGFAPADPLSPSLAGPRDPRSAPAGAPVARLARYAASSNEYKALVSSRITG
jgi:BON domain